MTTLAEAPAEQVSPDQIKHFDHDAQHLVMDYHLAGWRSHMTSNGHVFLKAPDGSETASVTRDSLRGRSGRNAAAPLKRWRRRQAEEWEAERKRKRAGSTFGIKDMDEVRAEEIPQLENRMPPRVAAALKNHPAIDAYVKANEDRFDGPKAMQESLYIGIDYDGPRPPWEMWTMVDTDAGVLVAHGPGYTREEAMKMLRAEGKIPAATFEEIMANAQDSTCPECGYESKNRGTLVMHVRRHTGYTCPECGTHTGFSGHSYATHRRDAHGVETPREERQKAAAAEPVPNSCTSCGQAFPSPQGLANHERMQHGVDKHARVLSLFKAAERPLRPTDLRDALSLTDTGAKSTLKRMMLKGEIVRVAPGMYMLAETVDDVMATSPDVPEPVTPERDTETEDVTVTSQVVPPVVGTAADMLAQVQGIVSAPLLEELARLRGENADLRLENEKLTKQLDDADALLGMVSEYRNRRAGGGA